MKRLILSVKRYEVKAALIEEDKIMEVFIERRDTKEITGNIYKGKIDKILPGMGSAFVDIGLDKNAFLYLKKYNTLTKDSEIIVQVNNNPRDEKGARLSLEYSIPGKYLVLLPNSKNISVSNKIKDEKEKERLKSLFLGTEKGIIIRTSAVEVSEETLLKEYKFLLLEWECIEKRFLKARIGEILYTDNNIIKKITRDIFNHEIYELIVDNKTVYDWICSYLKDIGEIQLIKKVKKYTGEEDMLEFYEINQAIENALKSKVWLDCGGYLIIEKTEALISIDVNTGKNIGDKELKETILQTNIEAAVEISRQLRLRNLAGIIIIDFIDMKNVDDRKILLKVFEESLKKDRIKNTIVHFTDLGLVEMTRKRQGKELLDFYKEKCPYCDGTGTINSLESTVLKILSEVKKLSNDKDISKIEIKAKKNLLKEIKDKGILDFIKEYLKNRNKEIILSQNEDIILNDYQINLYK